jgi:hypothetical protein
MTSRLLSEANLKTVTRLRPVAYLVAPRSSMGVGPRGLLWVSGPGPGPGPLSLSGSTGSGCGEDLDPGRKSGQALGGASTVNRSRHIIL